MVLIDSSVLIAFYNNLDPLYNQAQKELSFLFKTEDQIILPEDVISEVYTVILYKCGKNKANHFIEFILHNDKINIVLIDQDILDRTFGLISKINKKLSFVDITLLSFVSKFKCNFITYDKDLKNSYRKLFIKG